jgi:hypothetical protein
MLRKKIPSLESVAQTWTQRKGNDVTSRVRDKPSGARRGLEWSRPGTVPISASLSESSTRRDRDAHGPLQSVSLCGYSVTASLISRTLYRRAAPGRFRGVKHADQLAAAAAACGPESTREHEERRCDNLLTSRYVRTRLRTLHGLVGNVKFAPAGQCYRSPAIP